MAAYKTRKHQLAAFRGLNLPRRIKRRVAKALRDAAMVGVFEERDRTLTILREHPGAATAANVARIVSSPRRATPRG